MELAGDTIFRMLQIAALIEVLVCWVVWTMAFVKPRKEAAGQKQAAAAPASKWGIVLVTVGLALIWMWIRPAGMQKSMPSLIASMVLGPFSVALAWAAARRLGKQWRYVAAVSEDHELIQTGPYRWVRHPIYLSMLGMLMATGAAWTWWPMWIAGAVTFLAGTEVRVRAEDRLLEDRFQDSFRAYRRRVPAYIPFLR